MTRKESQASLANTQTPRLVSAHQIAKLLSCSPKTVHRLGQNGCLPPPIAVGGLRRWRLDDGLAAIQIKPTPPPPILAPGDE